MTYNHDLERNKYAGSGLGDYDHMAETGRGSGKWYLIAIALIIGLLLSVGLLSGTSTSVDSTTTETTTETVPAAPASTPSQPE